MSFMRSGDIDVERTPSKAGGSRSGLTSSALQANFSQSSMDADVEAPESAFQSAYTAPPYPRPQADRDHEQELALDRERGDLTAHNLEQIPNAEQVAPGIRLDRGGNDFHYPNQGHGQRSIGSTNRDVATQSAADPTLGDEDEEQDDDEEGIIPHNGARKRSILSINAPSSVDATGRSSNGRAELDMSDDREDNENYEENDELFDEKNLSVIHERVGGSGATSENASKGASVGHFGPLGEAIPGVPPHLDPRQPHFRPPSPSAASVVSVAVHPPASPKYNNSVSGLDSVAGAGDYNSSSSIHRDISDSGEETESFENGAMTPTLSEEIEDDEDEMDKNKYNTGRDYDASSPTPSPSLATAENLNPFSFGRLNLGGPQVSFSDNVLSRDLDGFTSLSRTARAPSIAATAGSSRAPSARGLSPPVSISRGGGGGATTEGSSLEEYDSTGTGLGESGIETPSMVRSQRSSYSAPSSEVEPTNGSIGMEAGDAATRARGATLIPINTDRLTAGVSSGNLQEEAEDDLRGAPSLAPSEAGSDSTRSVTQDSSSMGHGIYPNPSSGAMAIGGHSSSNSDRFGQMHSSSLHQSSPGTFEAHSFSDAAVTRGSSLHPVLPSLLAIKRAAGLRRESGAGSTAATAGTASPEGNLSDDGDSEADGLN